MFASEWGTDTQLNSMREAIRKANCNIEGFLLQHENFQMERTIFLACHCSTLLLIPPTFLHTNNSFIPKSHPFFPSFCL